MGNWQLFDNSLTNMEIFIVLTLAAMALADRTDPYRLPDLPSFPTTSANNFWPFNYGGYYYGKRSADAEPEADPLYGVYGYSAYTPYRAYRPYAYTTRWGYGKRSADAEPESDVLNGAYRYGYSAYAPYE